MRVLDPAGRRGPITEMRPKLDREYALQHGRDLDRPVEASFKVVRQCPDECALEFDRLDVVAGLSRQSHNGRGALQIEIEERDQSVLGLVVSANDCAL